MDPMMQFLVPGVPSYLRRFQCPNCFKVLSSKQNYKEHLYIHTGEKPFKCTEPGCMESFRQGSQLSVHKRIHRQVRKLQSRSTIQIPKVRNRQLTDLLSLEALRTTVQRIKGNQEEEVHLLPSLGQIQEQDVKLPSNLFYLE